MRRATQQARQLLRSADPVQPSQRQLSDARQPAYVGQPAAQRVALAYLTASYGGDDGHLTIRHPS